MKTIKAEDIDAKHMAEDPEYREAYEALEGEFAIINALIRARAHSKLSQA